ncbi:MAG: hypothetical protein U0163_14570 [Gemmatimonadaceae bacterium]
MVSDPPNADRTAVVKDRDPPVSAGGRGITVVLGSRSFLIPSRVVPGLHIQPTLGLEWRVRPQVLLSLDLQSVDNSGPGRQGPYLAQRALGDSAGSGNFLQETTVGLTITPRPLRAAGFELTASASFGRRSYSLERITDGTVALRGNETHVIPSATLRWVARSTELDWGLGLTWAGFPKASAMYVRRLPEDSMATFGRALAVAADVRWHASRELSVAAQTALPMTGHNGIERARGMPVRVASFLVGGEWTLNPELSVRGFLTNELGRAGALQLVADREYVALGFDVRAMPGRRDVLPSSPLSAPRPALTAPDAYLSVSGGADGVRAVGSAALVRASTSRPSSTTFAGYGMSQRSVAPWSSGSSNTRPHRDTARPSRYARRHHTRTMCL